MGRFKIYINQDGRNDFYHTKPKFKWLDWALLDEQYWIHKYLKYLRSEEYFCFVQPCKFLRFFYLRKKNKLGSRLGFFIPAGCFGPNLQIYHYGSIIVNPSSHIGANCEIHANCLIGNKGSRQQNDAPVLGDNIEIGNNAQILGGIRIADNCIIGAGSIVVKTVDVPGSTIIGVPGTPKI